ncbi:MAG: efflux RND transporter permease subunit [Planctomycetota bacterium]|jgi:multidrug efflux pump|nr:efflux RND transporter permease subunit [Planctomycetota bacterium]
MAKFFINRPIFAWVIAIVMMLAGLICIVQLPVAQYPNIAMPEVSIDATYPGASAETLSNTVTQVIEQNMNGIDNLLYMSSSSESSGRVSITLTFETGTDADIAQVQVQNKLQLATPMLPAEVQRQGISVRKSSASFLMVAGFISTDGSMNEADISDYVNTYLKDTTSRLHGVGEVMVFGAERSMRIWVDPAKLSNYSLTLADIQAVIQKQNLQVSSGQLGGMPQDGERELNAAIIAQSQLQTVGEFENMLIRVNQDGSSLRMKDVARVELGQNSYDFTSRYNGSPSAGMGIRLASGANALSTADVIKKYLDDSKRFFPKGLECIFPYDTTPFVRISITAVVHTLIEAIVLVILVLYIFLQNWRTTFIPAIAVPVVLLGSFAALLAFGFSINTLTMLGMVLAIGLLVDDAIVVVENVERLISEEGLSPKAAAEKSMEQLTGALIGTAMVVVAVFLPMAFFGGSTGVIYRQFSITICTTMVLSIVVAVVLTPALCATMLRAEDFAPEDQRPKPRTPLGHFRNWFFRWFNRGFAFVNRCYVGVVGHMVHRWVRFIGVYILIILALLYSMRHIPSAFLPDEDQGIMLVEIQLPAGATMNRTMAVADEVSAYFLEQEKDSVEAVFYVCGFSFSGQGQNSGLAFVRLRDWELRDRPEMRVQPLANRANMHFYMNVRDANVYAIVPPAVLELGFAGGFDFMMQDQANVGHARLMEERNKFLAIANSPEFADRLVQTRPNGKDDNPQYRIELDQARAFSYRVELADIHDMLQKGWGSGYINDFMHNGRIKKVIMMSEPGARMVPEDFDKWYIRNSLGKMVPFGSLIKREWIYGSPRLERYNGLPSVQIMGNPAPGMSTGQAMLACEEIMKRLDPGVGLTWTGLSYQERAAGEQTMALYTLSIIAIFLFLAALYESWTIPFSILLSIPIGVLGVALAALVFKMSNDVYFQVGFLTIIGLAAKNAILIVEFARELHEQHGMTATQAVLEACRLRLRPICMTVLTFVLGVFPLAVTTGAGSGAQNAIGVGIVGGMVTNSLLGIIFVPLFFVLVVWMFSKKARREDREARKSARLEAARSS